MTELKVPLLPDESEKVEVIAIYCKKGERVEHDQNLMEIETDKVVLEIFAPQDGVISAIKVKVGDKVAQETTLCVLNPDKDTYQEDVDHIQAMFESELGEESVDDTDYPDIEASLTALETEKYHEETSQKNDATAKVDDKSAIEEPSIDSAAVELEQELEQEPRQTSEKTEIEHFIGQEVFDDEDVEAEVEKAEVENNEINAAEVDASEVDAPELDTPEVDSPEVDSPKVDSVKANNAEGDNAELDGTEVASSEIESTGIEDTEVQAKGDIAHKAVAKEQTGNGFLIFFIMLVVVGLGAYAFYYFDLVPVLKELIERVI